jgi:hypothetical protein
MKLPIYHPPDLFTVTNKSSLRLPGSPGEPGEPAESVPPLQLGPADIVQDTSGMDGGGWMDAVYGGEHLVPG